MSASSSASTHDMFWRPEQVLWMRLGSWWHLVDLKDPQALCQIITGSPVARWDQLLIQYRLSLLARKGYPDPNRQCPECVTNFKRGVYALTQR